MKATRIVSSALAVAIAFVAVGPSRSASAEPDLSWHSIDGGGGESSGAGFALTGSIGQPDAGAPMAGGTFTLTGGFFSGLTAPFANPVPGIALLPMLGLTALLLGTGLLAARRYRVRR